MKKTTIYFALLFLTCTTAHAHDEPAHAHEHTACAKGQHVVVSEAVQKTMGLTTVRAERRAVASARTFPGRFELKPEARRTVATPLAGRVTLHVAPLARVKKGERVFSVFSPDLLTRAREIAVLEKRLAVYRAAQAPNAELESDLALRRATYTALLAGATETNGIVMVAAPTDGVIDRQRVQDGAWLEVGTAVFEVIDPTDLRFVASVAAADAARLTDGSPATVNGIKGRIRRGVGDASGLVPVYVYFEKRVGDNACYHVIAGARGKAVCVLDENEKPHVAVPTEAIVMVGLQPTVFVRNAHHPDRFQVVAVTPLARGGEWTAVKGLYDQAEVVCAGAYELKLALQTTPTPAGHFHADGTFHEGEH